MISILAVSSLELHSSGTEPVTFFEAQPWLGREGTILVWGGLKQWFGVHGPGMLTVAPGLGTRFKFWTIKIGHSVANARHHCDISYKEANVLIVDAMARR